MEDSDDNEQIKVIPMEMVFLVVKKEVEDQIAGLGDQNECEYTLKPESVIKAEVEEEVTKQWKKTEKGMVLGLGELQRSSFQEETNLKCGGYRQLQSFAKNVDGRKTYSCDVCGYETNRTFNFKKHLATHANSKKKGKKINSPTQGTCISDNKSLDYFCESLNLRKISGNTLTSTPSYNDSSKPNFFIRVVDGKMIFTCKVCKHKTEEKTSMNHHLASHSFCDKRKYKCDMCTKEFQNSCNLSRHKRTHSIDNPSKTRENLKSDTSRTHSIKLLNCDKCHYSSTDSSNMRKHKWTHLDVKPALFPCTLCEFSAAHKHHLTQHMSKHTGAKPYACAECDYRATREEHLKRHVRSVHSAEKSFSCTLCGAYSTSDKSHLSRHMKSKHPEWFGSVDG